MSELLRDFAAAVARHPDRVALIDGRGRAVTFAQLHARSRGLARAWRARGIGRGDRVLIAMAVDADLYAALAALWMLGATAVLPEPAMGLAGLRHALRRARPRAVCTSGAYRILPWIVPALWPLTHLRPVRRAAVARGTDPDGPPPAGGDVALISFTSGTGGLPKAIPRSHDFLAAQHRAIAPLLDSARDERDLVAFPVFVLVNIASGRSSILPNWRMSRLGALSPARLRDWLVTQQATRALLPPSLCAKLAEAGGATDAAGGDAPGALHTVFTGGGPVFPDLIDRVQRAWPGLRLICVYGSTEAEPIAHLDASDITDSDRAAMDGGQGLLVGRPVAAVRLRIVGQEIQVAGAHVNGGYLDLADDADTKLREGTTIWHRTGDAGRIDEAGRLWLLGRSGTAVRIAGQETLPFAVELAVRRWPGVANCALMDTAAGACLVIEGDARHAVDWRARAAVLGIGRVLPVARIPMDRRHVSKIDRAALRACHGL